MKENVLLYGWQRMKSMWSPNVHFIQSCEVLYENARRFNADFDVLSDKEKFAFTFECAEICGIVVGHSGEFLFVDQSNFFLNDYADGQPSSRNTHQEYSFHLYSRGTSPPPPKVGTFEGIGKQHISIGKMSPSLPKMRQRIDLITLDLLHIYSIGPQ